MSADPLSEEKLADYERRAEVATLLIVDPADAISLLAEVRLGREALKALEAFVAAGLATGGAGGGLTGWEPDAECWQIGYERLAAILTPEVLRLIEAGRKLQSTEASVQDAKAEWRIGGREVPLVVALHLAVCAREQAIEDMEAAALALPFEKPAEPEQVTKEQLPKKGGE